MRERGGGKEDGEWEEGDETKQIKKKTKEGGGERRYRGYVCIWQRREGRDSLSPL